MGLDLTLCLVPKQVKALFLKAENDFAYGERMQFITETLEDANYFQHPHETEADVQFSNDVTALKKNYQFTDAHHFYDDSRDSSTVDYLLNEHMRATNCSISPSLLWEGGTAFPTIRAGQGIPIRLYNEKQIEEIFLLLADLEFSDLLVHYDYEKMQEVGVYKLTRPENLWKLELTFYAIQDIFLLAHSEGLLVFKKID